jgi:ribosome-binding factor A
MTSSRVERVADEIQKAVAHALQFEIHDARLGFITVTGVKLSPDLGHARIFVSLLSEGKAREDAMKALEAASGFVRRRIGATVPLRRTPQIVFTIDTSIEQGARIEDLLRDAGRKEPDDAT